MPRADVSGMTFEYEIQGPAGGEVVLLVMGAGGQLTLWPQGLLDLLVDKGFRVVTYDARDVGLSERVDSAYGLGDMAADAAGLLDAVEVPAAHVVGVSMGGMVAQLLATDHPDRVLSLTSIMSTTANPELPGTPPELVAAFLTAPPDPGEDLEVFLDHSVANARRTQSPAYPADERSLREQFAGDYRRAHHPAGLVRHHEAIVAAADRRPKLKGVAVPALVIHGEEDPLVPPECGRDTAAAIPGAELLLVPGMGHDLPPQLLALFADAIDGIARRARG
ncbi:alpha/beta fold hydrolase [Lentzea sp. NPDC058436]|uniref:alpha/beta fold hydrolase n=1 Tax=Lentzea sp. NPDC058436 TaxID=3346499 RepID=UPI0036577200